MADSLNEIMSQPGVRGVVLSDASGLSLAAAGEAPYALAGMFTAVSGRAEQMREGTDGAAPVVKIETENRTIYIRKQNDITCAIYKDPKGDGSPSSA